MDYSLGDDASLFAECPAMIPRIGRAGPSCGIGACGPRPDPLQTPKIRAFFASAALDLTRTGR
jgi:hypothetical protein